MLAEQAGFSLTWSETPENMFSHDMAQLLSTVFHTMSISMSASETPVSSCEV